MAERKKLPLGSRVPKPPRNEDDADVLISERRLREDKLIPLEDYLKKHGIEVESSGVGARIKRVR